MDYAASMTTAEAAQACGVSERTIRGRIERGKLRTVKRGGRVHIATVDLLEAGLLPVGEDRATPGTPSRGRETGQTDVVALLAETMRALREADEERGRLRGLLESAEAKERLERASVEAAQAEVMQLRAKVQELEARQVADTPDASTRAENERPSFWMRMLGGDGRV